jgi:hypothetical protein
MVYKQWVKKLKATSWLWGSVALTIWDFVGMTAENYDEIITRILTNTEQIYQLRYRDVRIL